MSFLKPWTWSIWRDEDEPVYGPKELARREALERNGLDPDRALPFNRYEREEDAEDEESTRLFAGTAVYVGGSTPEDADLYLIVLEVPDGIRYLEDCWASTAYRIAKAGEYSAAVAWIATQWSVLHNATGFGSVKEARESLKDFFETAGFSSSIEDLGGSLRAWSKRFGTNVPELDEWSLEGFSKKNCKFFTEQPKRGRRGSFRRDELASLEAEIERLISEEDSKTDELVKELNDLRKEMEDFLKVVNGEKKKAETEA